MDHAKPVKNWPDEHADEIELFCLPSYAPEHNPDEYLNRDLKQSVAAQAPARSKSKLKEQVTVHMKSIQKLPARVKSYFKNPDVRYAATCVAGLIITREIEKAAAVFADLTYARPSVYFEIGYAKGLGIPTILTCRKDHLDGTQDDLRVHFDPAQHKISYWELDEKNEFLWADETLHPAKRLSDLISSREKFTSTANCQTTRSANSEDSA